MLQSKSGFRTLTDAATVAVDFNVSQNNQVTVAGNRTLTFANGKSGHLYAIKIKQDATGSRLITFPASVKWAGGSAPTLTTTAARTDLIVFLFDGTNYLDVAIVKDFNLA
jgi:hypothetical protein